MDKRFVGISDDDLWAEWVRRREARRMETDREYQRNYKRKMRAGVPKGKRGIKSAATADVGMKRLRRR